MASVPSAKRKHEPQHAEGAPSPIVSDKALVGGPTCVCPGPADAFACYGAWTPLLPAQKLQQVVMSRQQQEQKHQLEQRQKKQKVQQCHMQAAPAAVPAAATAAAAAAKSQAEKEAAEAKKAAKKASLAGAKTFDSPKKAPRKAAAAAKSKAEKEAAEPASPRWWWSEAPATDRDPGKWNLYTDEECLELERAFSIYEQGGLCKHEMTVGPRDYEIQFISSEQMTQKNTRTGFERRVHRGSEPPRSRADWLGHCAECTDAACAECFGKGRTCAKGKVELCIAGPGAERDGEGSELDGGSGSCVSAKLFSVGSAVISSMGISFSTYAVGPNCTLYDVPVGTPEFENVRTKFGGTPGGLPGAQLLRVQVVANRRLYRRYQVSFLDQLEQNAQNPALACAPELQLFHGTRMTPPRVVYSEGLDHRVGQTSGFYGAGTYFSESPAYCDHFAYRLPSGHRQIMLCAVLTGNAKEYGMERKRDLRRPPEAPEFCAPYNSVTGLASHNGARMHVVYDNARCYPQYLLTYADSLNK
jgi:hypothetical protein